MSGCQDDISTASATSQDEPANASDKAKPVQSPSLDNSECPLEDLSTQTPAFLSWPCNDGQTRSLPQKDGKTLTLSLRHIGGFAFFRLFTTVSLKAFPNTRTKFYIHLHPEWVLAMTLNNSLASVTDEASKRLGSSTMSLDFCLSRPPDIIGPQVDLLPRTSACAQVLEQLRSLARSQRLTIFIPHTVTSKAQLQSVCDRVTRLKTIEKDADLTCLYQGKGGQLLYSGLPSYTDIEPPPPPPPPVDSRSTHGTKKRRRDRRSSSAESDPTVSSAQEVRKILGIVAKLEQRLDRQDTLIQELQRKVEQRDVEVASLARVIDEHQCGQSDLEKEIDDIRETVDVRVDDAILDARLELEAFVNEKVADVEETIVRHVQARRVSVVFDDYAE